VFVSVPGDRREQDAREIGQMLGGGVFDRIIIRKTRACAGAKKARCRHIRAGLQAAGFPESQIAYTRFERDAVATALNEAERGDLVMVFADEPTESWKQIIYWGKQREGESNIGVIAQPTAIPPTAPSALAGDQPPLGD
jgi:cyanophycin synthetase